ncbi:hypothetical protein M5K25_016570 [Dendrobium thyrsiflorum]|uniref:Uncharacterized protein n=1 Tax=Dendrobium thyrsiflorum TaxID=117978 RepID=A0ABD0UK12_DENTH
MPPLELLSREDRSTRFERRVADFHEKERISITDVLNLKEEEGNLMKEAEKLETQMRFMQYETSKQTERAAKRAEAASRTGEAAKGGTGGAAEAAESLRTCEQLRRGNWAVQGGDEATRRSAEVTDSQRRGRLPTGQSGGGKGDEPSEPTKLFPTSAFGFLSTERRAEERKDGWSRSSFARCCWIPNLLSFDPNTPLFKLQLVELHAMSSSVENINQAVGFVGAPGFAAIAVATAKFVVAAAVVQPELTSADVSWPEFEGSAASATFVGKPAADMHLPASCPTSASSQQAAFQIHALLNVIYCWNYLALPYVLAEDFAEQWMNHP